MANPCKYGAAITAGIRGLSAFQAAGGGINAIEKLGKGDYFGAALEGLGAFASIGQFFKACFAAGTSLRTPDGSKPIEEFQVGDLILSRDENDPNAPVTVHWVEEVFARSAFIRVLTVAGRKIRTIAEPPFWVREKGWTPAGAIHGGDSVASVTGGWLTVETVRDTGEFVQVHNVRVADDHTYFVGGMG